MLATKKTPELSDEAIVAQALIERSAFAVIVDRYEAKLTRYIRRLGVHLHEDRQDILQDIFLKVYRNLNGFDKALSFSSWIYRIAHNETITWHRKQKVRPEGHLASDADEIFLFVADDPVSADKLLDSKIDAQLLRRALLLLASKYRDPIILRFFEYKEYDEISDILKIPIGTVGTLISRGKKKLEHILKVKNPTLQNPL